MAYKDFDDFLMQMIKEELRNYDSWERPPAANEMDRLEEMLIDAEIPYLMRGRSQICYYPPHSYMTINGTPIFFGYPKPRPVCSVICRPGSYGFEEGLLEISGLMTAEERMQTEDFVLGHLTAENVFARIQAHYMQNK